MASLSGRGPAILRQAPFDVNRSARTGRFRQVGEADTIRRRLLGAICTTVKILWKR